MFHFKCVLFYMTQEDAASICYVCYTSNAGKFYLTREACNIQFSEPYVLVVLPCWRLPSWPTVPGWPCCKFTLLAVRLNKSCLTQKGMWSVLKLTAMLAFSTRALLEGDRSRLEVFIEVLVVAVRWIMLTGVMVLTALGEVNVNTLFISLNVSARWKW